MKVEVKGLETLEKYLNTEVPERVDRAMQQAAEATAKDLRESLKQAVGTFGGEVGWTSYLYNSIRAYNSAVHGWGTGNKPDQWGVEMLPYGFELDKMQPHKEVLTRGKKIATWARAHDIKGNTIRVQPHPFIDVGTARAGNHIDSAIEQFLSD